MYRVVLFALCACNQVFGNDRVGVVDGRHFDGLLDGVPHCPMTGMVPVFSPLLSLAIDQNCNAYEQSTDRDDAIGVCATATTVAIFEGPRNGPLVQNPTLPVSDDSLQVDVARLSPEGDLLVISTFDLTSTTSEYLAYTYDPAGWMRGPDLPFPQFNSVSPPSRGPDRRILVYESKAIAHEYHQGSDGQWSELRLVTIGSDLLPHSVYLSPDGLRIIVAEGLHTLYADRPDLGSDFSAPVELPTSPPGEVFVTEDCTHVYVSGVEAIFVALAE
jgi:hypothetical protein